jgi:hypothetical protein
MSAYNERDRLREVGLAPDKPAAEDYLRHGLEGQGKIDGNEYLLPSQSLEGFAARSGEGADWVIENLLARGEVTDFAGRAKLAGKTTFWCSAIDATTAGETHAGLETQPTKFLYLTEQGNNFLEAVEDAGLLNHPDALRIVQYRHVAGTAWASLIDAAARDAERMGTGAVIVDTFATFSGLADADENLSGPVGGRMRAARLAAQKHNVAVVIIRHTGKDGRPRGSSSFEAEADICVVLSKPEGRHDPRVRKLSAVGRHGMWERNVQLADGHFVSLGGDDRVAFKKAVAFIRATLPASPDAEFKKRDLLEARKPADDISSASVDRALEFLVKEEAVGERQLMNARGKPRVYWLAARGPEDPDADQNEETRVDMRERVHFQQTSPPIYGGDANKLRKDFANSAPSEGQPQASETKGGGEVATNATKPSLADGGSTPGVAEGGDDVAGLGSEERADLAWEREARRREDFCGHGTPAGYPCDDCEIDGLFGGGSA